MEKDANRSSKARTENGVLAEWLAGVPSAAQEFLKYLRRDPLFAFALLVVILSLILTAVGPAIAPCDPECSYAGKASVPPPKLTEMPRLLAASLRGDLEEPVHWFGTDAYGLDVFSRVIAAPRTDIRISLTATLVSLAAGTLLGLLAGYYRSWASELLMRVSDVSQSFPMFILGMVLVALAGRNVNNIVIAIIAVYGPVFIRLTRSQALSLRDLPFVEAARAMGNPEIVIALKHVLPNALTPSLVQSSNTLGRAILLTSGLSFLGAGVRPPTPEWGSMIAIGANQIILGEWWPSVFPGLAISVVVFGYAVVGNRLEEAYGAR
jgi:peptide/nickel transport system permease protein